MVDITAKAILDSESPNRGENSRLITMLLRYPKFIHGEHLRHRSMSFSVSSSRAIPVSKNLEEVRNDALRAGPVWWGREQKGMVSGDELDNTESIYIDKWTQGKKDAAIRAWRQAADQAIHFAGRLQEIGAHKSIVNRILEPFLHVNVLVSGTTPGWMNFFGLRLDKAAQPEIRVLAEECWKVWNDSRPQTLQPGEWHLPFVDAEYSQGIYGPAGDMWIETLGVPRIDLAKRISAACCAHLSFESFETGKRMTLEQCFRVHDQLFPGPGKPIHASPFEHQATPDGLNELYQNWHRPELSGNFGPGWIQYRKTLFNEAVAPLPEGYKNVSS